MGDGLDLAVADPGPREILAKSRRQHRPVRGAAPEPWFDPPGTGWPRANMARLWCIHLKKSSPAAKCPCPMCRAYPSATSRAKARDVAPEEANSVTPSLCPLAARAG